MSIYDLVVRVRGQQGPFDFAQGKPPLASLRSDFGRNDRG